MPRSGLWFRLEPLDGGYAVISAYSCHEVAWSDSYDSAFTDWLRYECMAAIDHALEEIGA